MGRIISAKIEFQFDIDYVQQDLDQPMTEEELFDYARDTFIEDIYNLVKFNELHLAVKTEYVEESLNG